MLTSKPPFQSSTTDEIYRRARERDYEWPDPETTQKFISADAKDLVASMLESPDTRPEPDAIVNHPWFQMGYMPAQSDITPRLRELPPDKAEFYLEDLSEEAMARSYEAFRDQCVECMVGSLAPVQMIRAQVWKEMAAEEKASLTPVIPLAEGLVYRPFEEYVREAQAQKARAGLAGPSQSRSAAVEESTSRSTQGTTNLLRQPPQSFAAQQRAQNRPPPTVPSASTATVTNTATFAPKASVATSTARGIAPADDIYRLAATTTATTSTTSTTTTKQPAPSLERQQITEKPRATEDPRREGPTMRSRPRREAQHVELPLRTRSEPIPRSETAAAPRTRSETIPRSDTAAAPRSKVPSSSHTRTLSATSGVEKKAPVSERATSSAPATVRSRPKEMKPTSVFDPTERPRSVPGTKPDVVLEGLRRLQTELERALNSRTMAIITSKTVTPPAHPEVVIKWVDYTNKFGLGYILNDGSIGCVLRDIPTAEGTNVALLPPVCMLIQGAERHVQRRQDEGYADRHQPVPMRQNVHFFENRGESGLVHLPVPAEQFRVHIGRDGQPVKLEPGKDAFQHRKRERIILWKKFANYMAAYGRDDGAPAEVAPVARAQSPVEDTQAPAQVVTFYQRFGDVGCWVFGDGHLQVSSAPFPTFFTASSVLTPSFLVQFP
ncbi:hypothetical protein IMZ48_36485 [Candidatus Bathyarchaeota archaeon]|nr:hypothetical protein [Candidatus Bathyarchaeota archaeon]